MYAVADATPEDASLIAWAIMEAIGEELIRGWGENISLEDVRNVFESLAKSDDSQYSYRNSRIAVAPDGKKAGVCVSYNGGEIKKLRRSFFREANAKFGWEFTEEEIESLPGETGADEYYLDSLAVLPDSRGNGIGSILIEDAYKKAKDAGLPLGLLVADDNRNARRLYESLGFKPVGRRMFAGEEMTNMRRD